MTTATRRDAHSAIVIKVGGSTLEKAGEIFQDIARLRHAGRFPVVVHGGGPAINHWLRRAGVEPHFIDGRRVTDRATLEVVRAVMVGQLNGDIVRQINAAGGNAVGLNGLDAGMIQAQRAAPELGFVGHVTVVDPALIRLIGAAGYVPVIAPLGLDAAGECLNINADDAALAVAVALRASDLIFLSDVTGVHDRQGERIAEMPPALARALIADGTITGGMIPKIEACTAALEHVGRVAIVDGAAPDCLTQALGSSLALSVGTHIVRESALARCE